MLNSTSTRYQNMGYGRGGVVLRAPIGQFLEIPKIEEKAPAIFAEHAHDSRSEKYVHIPTFALLSRFEKEGFLPVEVRVGGSKDVDKRSFTKHLIRFRRPEMVAKVGDTFPEVVVGNSHDGTSQYWVDEGRFRVVCLNGLTVCESVGSHFKVPHRGHILDNVIEAAYRVVSNIDVVNAQIEDMANITLNQEEQVLLAETAVGLRFEDHQEVRISDLLRPRRMSDERNTLWNTFNRLQEGLVRGGIPVYTRNEQGRQMERRSREVNDIGGNVRLNQGLWSLAEKMRQLKMEG